MSELVEKLYVQGNENKGTFLGGLMQWAALHIEEQDAALKNLKEEFEAESTERMRLERVVFDARQQAEVLSAALRQTPGIQLAKDHAPHINVMAHHGVEPYAKKKRAKKA
jgi:hypothetical protein